MFSSGQTPLLLLGVDGGGTKTSAWILPVDHPFRSLHAVSSHRAESEVAVPALLGTGTAGPGNPRSVGFDAACANIEAAIHGALTDLQRRSGFGFSRDQIAATCVGLAGAGRTEEQEKIAAHLRNLGLIGRLKVTDDIEPIRWAAGVEMESPSERANAWVTLIAGTGSIARWEQVAPDGKHPILRAGGWGYLLGDEGSGYAIGLDALKQACREFDSGRAESPLTMAILDRLELDSPQSLVGWIYQTPIPRKQVADLAPLVIEARRSNPAADSIVRSAVRSWCELVSHVVIRGGREHAYSLAIAGGIPNHCPELVDELADQLRLGQMPPESIHIVQNPVVGCVALAHQLLS
ncbi:N-acetylglucosamine kinase [Pirellulaceae bacterium SH501]